MYYRTTRRAGTHTTCSDCGGTWDGAWEEEALDEDRFARVCASSFAQVARFRESIDIYSQMLARGVASSDRLEVLLRLADVLLAAANQ